MSAEEYSNILLDFLIKGVITGITISILISFIGYLIRKSIDIYMEIKEKL